MKRTIKVILFIMSIANISIYGQTIDHRCADIRQVPEAAIIQAKNTLHIAYGHTSHGSQLTSGLDGLVQFMNGLGYTHDLYTFNSDGSGDALDLREYVFDGADDLGSPDRTSWSAATRTYLNATPEINVIIWSWCGQVSESSVADINTYLNLMNSLENDYPNVQFVYMTGHLDGSGASGTLNQRNNQIRQYCQTNNKTLFDFADIESWDPDGLTNYMLLDCNDNCDYDSDADGSRDKNWAIDWQNAHVENVDWYDCDAAHSQPLNGNRKAYAAWWLWARLAGWSGPVEDTTPPSVPTNLEVISSDYTSFSIRWHASTDSESSVTSYRIYLNGAFQMASADTTATCQNLTPGTQYAIEISAVNGAALESERSAAVTAQTLSDQEAPSTPASLEASAVSSSQIDLEWNESSDNVGVSGYTIFRNSQEIGTVSASSFSDEGLNPSTTYTYHVQAYDAAENTSELSDPASATTFPSDFQPQTMRLESNDSEVVDAFIFRSEPNSNYGEEPYMDVTDHFLIKFLLPTSVMNKEILDAKLYLYVWNQTDYHASEFLDVYSMTSDWAEGEVTWNLASAGRTWNTPGGDYSDGNPVAQIAHQAGQENWDHTFYPPADLTTLVQEWVDGSTENFGLMITNEGETDIGLKASEYDDGSRPYLEITYTDKQTHVERERICCAETFRLDPCYPNPFNPETNISFFLPKRTFIAIKAYNVDGKIVSTIMQGIVDQGQHEFTFDGRQFASGIYVIGLEMNGYKDFQKIMLVK